MISAIVTALAALFKLAASWISYARDKTLIALGATQERAKINEASATTQESLKEVADERSSIDDPATDVDDLARELRRSGTGSRSDRKRPF
jgi:hypothetical protein